MQNSTAFSSDEAQPQKVKPLHLHHQNKTSDELYGGSSPHKTEAKRLTDTKKHEIVGSGTVKALEFEELKK